MLHSMALPKRFAWFASPSCRAKGDVSDFIELRRKEGLDDEAIERKLLPSASARRRRGRQLRHLTSLLSQR